VGENPGTADAAGINVTKNKYLATCIGAGISGLGGLYYVMDYTKGTWANDGGIEGLGWLAVALVIFATWKSVNAIWGSYLFGLLFWMYLYIPGLGRAVPGAVQDAALPGHHRRADLRLSAQQKGESAPRQSGPRLFPRGALSSASPKKRRTAEAPPQMGRRFVFISLLAAAWRPSAFGCRCLGCRCFGCRRFGC
jgi:hypothetical protein